MFISQLHFAEWERRKGEPAKSRGLGLGSLNFRLFPLLAHSSISPLRSATRLWYSLPIFFSHLGLFFFIRKSRCGIFILLVYAIFVLDLVHHHILCWCNYIGILINFPFILYKRWRQSVFWRNSRICRRILLLLAALVLSFYFYPSICNLFRSSRLILLVMDLVLCPKIGHIEYLVRLSVLLHLYVWTGFWSWKGDHIDGSF